MERMGTIFYIYFYFGSIELTIGSLHICIGRWKDYTNHNNRYIRIGFEWASRWELTLKDYLRSFLPYVEISVSNKDKHWYGSFPTMTMRMVMQGKRNARRYK